MVSLVLVELPDGYAELVPEELRKIKSRGAQRVGKNLSMVQMDAPEIDLQKEIKAYGGRAAVGAAQIWSRFPEYRSEFITEIERVHADRAQIIRVPLKNTYLGDIRTRPTLILNEGASHAQMSRTFNIHEEITITDDCLADFPQLLEKETAKGIAIENQYIYFCDGVSLLGTGGEEIFPGIRFLSARALIAQTNLLKVATDRGTPPPGYPAGLSPTWPKPYIPNEFSGAFLVQPSTPDNQGFADATINRILAGATLAGAPYGKIPYALRFTDNGWSGRPLDGLASRPYVDRAIPETYSVSVANPLLAKILTFLKTSQVQKFVNAKEDFRLLALDTVEDSRRSGVPVLAFAKIWMAVEWLLPFKTETTAQLALSLSAFSETANRNSAYKALKKSYGLRSQIVHGYSFARNEPIWDHLETISTLFRSTFLAALTVATPDELRDALMGHVLAGQQVGFNDKPPIPLVSPTAPTMP